MRAMVCDGTSGPAGLRLVDLPPPPLPPESVRIRVAAAGVNFSDRLLTEGRYQRKPPPPFPPGFEIAGTVMETTRPDPALPPGQPVLAVLDHGGWAEEVVAPHDAVLPLPPGLDLDEAAAFPIAHGTAHFGLVDRARLIAGETVLVHGAAGGVGLAAVACAKALGATVIATAAGPERLAVAGEAGADHLLDAATPDLRAAVKDLTQGRGVDVVFDPVGGDLFDASIRCAAPEGRLLVVGFASGRVPAPPANLLLVKNLSVIGYDWGAMRTRAPDRVMGSLADALEAWAQGRLKGPRVGARRPLAEAQAALEALAARAVTGKIVLRP
ncbi:NADPH:quinone oxidoreductase family protein [Pararhodospirillum oryzae]|uniref:NADPH:quinone oxidoreductase n=1 Tax=Pararhodospirillum oryzae TaxID=478448 RepID=A0A512H6X4_9PROT|nr:NADPH:quinone oxidoreductase family protein [Pararhodospirillum oryzae]GEO81203.1 NADPH:quinone oxidoreductase [Pararhodospirillum oryzae]